MVSNPDQRFRKQHHLRRRVDFDRVFAGRCRATDRSLTVYVLANGLGWCRLGLSVGRRVGPAVRRNRIRRQIREAFRRISADLPRGLDVVCVARPGAVGLDTDLPPRLRRLILSAAGRDRGRAAGSKPGPGSGAPA